MGGGGGGIGNGGGGIGGGGSLVGTFDLIVSIRLVPQPTWFGTSYCSSLLDTSDFTCYWGDPRTG